MKEVSLLGLHFERLYTQEVLQEALSRLATNITRDFSKFEAPLALCILNGSFIFAADLLRLLPFEISVEFVRYRSYHGLNASQKPEELLGLTQRIDRRDILIIEDIVDTGLTMQSLLDNLKGRGAHSIRIATMFTKSEAFVGNFAIDYVGFDLPNRFVVGYGLDYNGLGRNLSDLYILSDK
ncbi:MAG: hypoxanthine phosphoribosyltransferase [Bacteroides sp.]